jgi:polyisoprenoid-binding protein YceI
VAACIRKSIAILAILLPAAVMSPRAAVYEALPGESAMTYRIRHPLRTVEGVTKDFSCRVNLAQDTFSSQVTVTADVRSFKSGNGLRDKHAAEAIHADQYPQVHFASDSVRAAGTGYRVYGRLTFAGRTRPVDFNVRHDARDGKVRVSGSFSINLPDYGVKPPSLLGMAAEDRLDIRFDLVARDDWAPGSAGHPWGPTPH